jgi:hypothetical protein
VLFLAHRGHNLGWLSPEIGQLLAVEMDAGLAVSATVGSWRDSRRGLQLEVELHEAESE